MVGWIVFPSNIFTHKIKFIFYLVGMVKKDFLLTRVDCSSIHLNTQNKIYTLFDCNRKKILLEKPYCSSIQHLDRQNNGQLTNTWEIHTLFDYNCEKLLSYWYGSASRNLKYKPN